MSSKGKTFMIGLDLDGVCYHFERTARYMLRRRIEDRGEPVPPELFEPSRSWNWISDHVGKDDWNWLWNHGVEHGLFRYGHVMGGSIEGVQELNNMGDVVVVTARPKNAVHDTLVWLATMFDKAPLSGLVIQSHGQVKSEVRPLPDVYIDDAPHNYEDLLMNTRSHVVQLVQPWNITYEPPAAHADRLLPALNWREVVEQVARAKKERGR